MRFGFRWIVFTAAILYTIIIVGTEIVCHIGYCSGQNIDDWLLVFAFSPIGIPAVLWSILVILKSKRPESKIIHNVATVFKYLLIGLVGLWVLNIIITIILGFVISRHDPQQTQTQGMSNSIHHK